MNIREMHDESYGIWRENYYEELLDRIREGISLDSEERAWLDMHKATLAAEAEIDREIDTRIDMTDYEDVI